jgi:hypothetical protein
MNIEKVAPKNRVNKIRNKTYSCLTKLIPIPVVDKAVRNAIENIETVKDMLNKNSKNLVSISYCEDMLINRTFLIYKNSC